MGNRRLFSTAVLIVSTIASSAYGETVYIRASAARLRSTQSLEIDDTIVGRVYRNQPVEVLERTTIPGKGSWLRVKSGGKEGWINAKITSKTKTIANAAPSSVAAKPVAKAPAPAKATEKPEAAKPVVAKAEKPAAKPVEKATAKPTETAAAAKPTEQPAAKPKEIAKAEPTKAEKPAAAKPQDKKPNLPVVDRIAADGSEKCITQIGEMTKEQQAVLAPLLKSGQLHENWRSPRGAAFSINDKGPIVVTLHALPAATIKALVTGTQFPETVVRDALKNGVVQFNGTICKKGDTYAINLVGAGMATNGMTGHLALLPDKKGGFKADGAIAKSKFAENFSASGSAQ